MLSNEDFHKIIDIVNSNDNLVEHDYKGKKNQVLVSKELTDKIVAFTNGAKDDDENLKDTVKLVVRRVFNLCDSDLVLFKNGSTFIKLFAEDVKQVINEKTSTPVAKRFNGIDENELIIFHEDFFQKDEHQDFFLSIAEEFIEIYFNKKRISNSEYEQNVFSYILKITFEHLISIYNDDNEFFTGFAGYIFRIHFNEVFEYIADIMLERISLGSDFMVKFLSYYSAGIIVSDGHKYQVPSIKTDSGLRWSVVSMLSIAKLYSKTIKTISTLEQNIQESELLIDELYIDDLSPLEYHMDIVKDKKKIELEVSSIKKELDQLSISKLSEKDETKREAIQQEIIALKDELLDLKEDKENLDKTDVDKNVIQEYITLQKELDTIKRQLNRLYKIIEQNKESYLSLRDALVKALTSKKQKIKDTV